MSTYRVLSKYKQIRPGGTVMTAQLLRPITSVFRQGIIACVVFMFPVFLVLYIMTVPSGPWPIVLVCQIVISVAITIASWRFFGLGIWVSPESIAERGFFRPRREFTRAEISSIVLARAYSGTELHPQLFVVSPSGALLVRMRGQFWTRETMNEVAEILDVPVRTIHEPISVAELRETMPAILYWFERRPVLAGLAFAGAVMALGALALLVLQLAGVLG